MKRHYFVLLCILLIICIWISWEFDIFETIPLIGFQCPYGHRSLVANAVHHTCIVDPYNRKYSVSCQKCGYGIDLREISSETRCIWVRFANALPTFEIPIDPIVTEFPIRKLNSPFDSSAVYYFQQIHSDSVVVEGLYCLSTLPRDSIKAILIDYLNAHHVDIPKEWNKAFAVEFMDARLRNLRIKIALHDGAIGETTIRFDYSKLDDLFF